MPVLTDDDFTDADVVRPQVSGFSDADFSDADVVKSGRLPELAYPEMPGSSDIIGQRSEGDFPKPYVAPSISAAPTVGGEISAGNLGNAGGIAFELVRRPFSGLIGPTEKERSEGMVQFGTNPDGTPAYDYKPLGDRLTRGQALMTPIVEPPHFAAEADDSRVTAIAKGGANVAAGLAASFMSPLGAMLPAAGEVPALARSASGLFAADMLAAVPGQVKQVVNARTPQEAVEGGLGAIAGTAMGIGAALHGARGHEAAPKLENGATPAPETASIAEPPPAARAVPVELAPSVAAADMPLTAAAIRAEPPKPPVAPVDRDADLLSAFNEQPTPAASPATESAKETAPTAGSPPAPAEAPREETRGEVPIVAGKIVTSGGEYAVNDKGQLIGDKKTGAPAVPLNTVYIEPGEAGEHSGGASSLRRATRKITDDQRHASERGDGRMALMENVPGKGLVEIFPGPNDDLRGKELYIHVYDRETGDQESVMHIAGQYRRSVHADSAETVWRVTTEPQVGLHPVGFHFADDSMAAHFHIGGEIERVDIPAARKAAVPTERGDQAGPVGEAFMAASREYHGDGLAGQVEKHLRQAGFEAKVAPVYRDASRSAAIYEDTQEKMANVAPAFRVEIGGESYLLPRTKRGGAFNDMTGFDSGGVGSFGSTDSLTGIKPARLRKLPTGEWRVVEDGRLDFPDSRRSSQANSDTLTADQEAEWRAMQQEHEAELAGAAGITTGKEMRGFEPGGGMRASKAEPVFEPRLRSAYDALVSRDRFRFPSVSIGALAKESGIPLADLKARLMALHKQGRVVLSPADWSLSSPEARAGVMDVSGQKMTQVRPIDDVLTSKTPKGPEGIMFQRLTAAAEEAKSESEWDASGKQPGQVEIERPGGGKIVVLNTKEALVKAADRYRPPSDASHLQRVADAVEPLKDKVAGGGVRVRVLRNEGDLPEGVRRRLNPGDTHEGIVDTVTGDVYLFSDHLRSPERAAEVFAHEVVGHYGVERLIGDKEFQKIADSLFREVPAAARDIARRYADGKSLDSLTPEERALVAREYVARLAERPALAPRTWERIVAAVRRALKKLGIQKEWSESDIRDLLRRAAREVQSLRESVGSGLMGSIRAVTPEASEAVKAGVIHPEDAEVLDRASRVVALVGKQSGIEAKIGLPATIRPKARPHGDTAGSYQVGGGRVTLEIRTRYRKSSGGEWFKRRHSDADIIDTIAHELAHEEVPKSEGPILRQEIARIKPMVEKAWADDLAASERLLRSVKNLGPDVAELAPRAAEIEAAFEKAIPGDRREEVSRFVSDTLAGRPTVELAGREKIIGEGAVRNFQGHKSDADAAGVGDQVMKAYAAAVAAKPEMTLPERMAVFAAETRRAIRGDVEPARVPAPLGIKNAITEPMHAAAGLSEREAVMRRAFPDLVAETDAAVKADPAAGTKLVDALRDETRPLTDSEDALLTNEMVRRQTERDVAERDMQSAKTDAELAASEARRAAAITAMGEIIEVSEAAGTANARGLNARKLLLNMDYTQAHMENSVRAVMNVEASDPEFQKELPKIKAEAEGIKAGEAEVEKAATAEKDQETEDHFARMLSEIRKDAETSKKGKKTLASFVADQADKARARRRARGPRLFSGLDPVDIADLSIIGADYLVKGIQTAAGFAEKMAAEFGEWIRPHTDELYQRAQAYRDTITDLHGDPKAKKRIGADELTKAASDNAKAGNALDHKTVYKLAEALARQGVGEQGGRAGMTELMDAVHARLSPFYSGLTVREVRDTFTDYGKATYPSKDKIKMQLAESRVLGRLQTQLENAQKGLASAKTGFQRGKATEEVRRLQKEVNGMMKKMGVKVSDPAKQLATSLDAAKSAARNRIEELNQAMASRSRIVDGHQVLVPDSELRVLRAERDAAQKAYDEMFPAEPLTDAEKVNRAVKSLDRRIADEDKLLESGANKRSRPAYGTPASDAIERRQSELESMRALRKELYEASGEAAKDANVRMREAIAKRDAALQAKIDGGDFTKISPKKTVLEDATLKAKAELQRKRNAFDSRVEEIRLANRAKWEKAFDQAVGYSRGAKLTRLTTLAKLATYSLQAVAVKPLTELTAKIASHTPGLRRISDLARIEGQGSAGALGGFYKGFIYGAKNDAAAPLRQALAIISRGRLGDIHAASEIKSLYQREGIHLDPKWYDIPQLLHEAEKNPLKRADFEYAMKKLEASYTAQAKDTSAPAVREEMRRLAYEYAERSVLMNKNPVSTLISRGIRSLEEADKDTGRVSVTRKAGAAVLHTLFTFNRVASNHLVALFNHAFGLPTGGIRAASALVRGLETLHAKESDSIIRQIKAGSIGGGMLALGILAPQFFGGLNPRKKRDSDELKFAEMQIGDVKIPRYVSLAVPPLMAAQVGATITQTMREKLHGEERGIGAGVLAAGVATLESGPVVNEAARIGDLMHSDTTGKYLRDWLKGNVVPGALDELARALDTEDGDHVKRKSSNFLESFEESIPGLREDVPKAKRQR